MKNILKTLIVMLTSISLFGSANAGELTVSLITPKWPKRHSPEF